MDDEYVHSPYLLPPAWIAGSLRFGAFGLFSFVFLRLINGPSFCFAFLALSFDLGRARQGGGRAW